MRRASVVVARFWPRLAATRRAQDFSQFIFLLACSIVVAAWNSAVRSATSPALVIPLDTSRSPDWLRFGVSPARDGAPDKSILDHVRVEGWLRSITFTI